MKKDTLELFLSSIPTPTLQRTNYFSAAENKTFSLVRGSAFNAPAQFSGFRWSSAVQAVTALFLRYAAGPPSNKSMGGLPGLSGEARSLAASLDYAISKEPNWLLDMFGVDAHGHSHLRQLIIRTNPERKRPGPVVLSVCRRSLLPENIIVHIDGSLLTCATRLHGLADQIEELGARDARTTSHRRAGRPGKIVLPVNDEPEPIHDAYFQEIRIALNSSSVFSENSLKLLTQRINKDESILARNKRGVPLDQTVDHYLFGNPGIGLHPANAREALLRERELPLRVCIPRAEAATSILFYYLSRVKSYRVELRDSFPHSRDISLHMNSSSFSEQIDLTLLSLSAAAAYTSNRRKNEYYPFMIAPSNSYSLLSGNGKEQQATQLRRDSRLIFIDGAASHTASLRESVSRRHKVSGATIAVGTAQEIAAALRATENSYGFLWFPYNAVPFGLQKHQADDISIARVLHDRSEMILFAHRGLPVSSPLMRSLAVSLRGAWVHLLHDEALLRNLIRSYITERLLPLSKTH